MEEDKDEIHIELETSGEATPPKEEDRPAKEEKAIEIELEEKLDETKPEIDKGANDLDDLKAAAAIFRESHSPAEKEPAEAVAPPLEDSSCKEPELPAEEPEEETVPPLEAEPPPAKSEIPPSFGDVTKTPTSRLDCMPSFSAFTEKIFKKNRPVQTSIACPKCADRLVSVDAHFNVRGEPFAGWLCRKCVAIYHNKDNSTEFVSG